MKRPRSLSRRDARRAAWRPVFVLAASGCTAEPVSVERSPYIEVYTEASGELEAAGRRYEVQPGAPARIFVGAGSRRLVYHRGETHLVLPEVDGPSVRLDPFLRAAGVPPDADTTWRVEPEPVPELDVAAAVVAGGRGWRAEAVGGGTFEAPGPPGDGLWLVTWSRGGRAVALGRGAGAGGAAPAQLPRTTRGTGHLEIAYDSDIPAWAEVLPVVDDVPVPLPLAGGLVSRTRGLSLPARWGDDLTLAVRLRVRSVGQPAPDADRIFALEPAATSVLLPDLALAPMAPQPAGDLTAARPVGGSPPAVTWTPPESTSFWGAVFTDPDACAAGTFWVFGPSDAEALAVPEPLRDAGLLSGGLWAYALATPLDTLTAAEGRPPGLADWTSSAGHAGLMRGPLAGCDAGEGPTGVYGLVAAADDACDDAAVRASVVVDACGRVVLQRHRLDDAALESLRCGRWQGDVFTDAQGRAFPVRAESGGRFRIAHPDGDWRLLPGGAEPAVPVPPTRVLGVFTRVAVEAHLERPDFPGEAILGSHRPDFEGEGRDGPFLEIRPDGTLRAAWAGVDVRGRLDASGNERGPWPVRRQPHLCTTTTASSTLTAGADGVSVALRMRHPGPDLQGAPTVQILTATFAR